MTTFKFDRTKPYIRWCPWHEGVVRAIFAGGNGWCCPDCARRIPSKRTLAIFKQQENEQARQQKIDEQFKLVEALRLEWLAAEEAWSAGGQDMWEAARRASADQCYRQWEAANDKLREMNRQ